MRERARATNDGRVVGKKKLLDLVLQWRIEGVEYPVRVVDGGSVEPYRKDHTAQIAWFRRP